MKTITDLSAEIENKLSSLGLPSERLPSLYEPISYTLAGGGKRIRPLLLLMGVQACGGDPASALDAAAGIEMFHNFTLLHDDVMDRSEVRRGRPTVHRRWNENVAILSGDTMLTLATQLMSEVPDAALRRVLGTFNRMAIEVYEGQALDMDFEQRDDVTIPEYIEMIRCKTSALLGAAVKIGALIAGADSRTADALYEYGEKLGLAFQIRDDFLDVYGDPATFGKPIGGDIVNNKKTFLLLTALAKPQEEGVERLRSAMTVAAPEVRIAEVTRIYTLLGVAQDSSAAIRRYCDEALAALDRAGISPEGREEFRSLLNKLVARNK